MVKKFIDIYMLIARNRKKKKATSTNLFYDKSADALVLRNRIATNKSVLIATYFIKQSVFDTLLTKEECKKVIAWLCGKE